jgi:hypothetical protein
MAKKGCLFDWSGLNGTDGYGRYPSRVSGIEQAASLGMKFAAAAFSERLLLSMRQDICSP